MRPLNIALLAYGLSGKIFHAPFIDLHPGFHLIGCWERKQQQVQQDYPDAKSYPSLESLLADDAVELVVVNTPTYTHFEYARQALLARKHVIVEKAFTTTVAEAIALQQLAEQQERKLSVYQNRRWDSDFQTVSKIFQEGYLGDLVEAEFQFVRYKLAIGPKAHFEVPGPGAGLLKDLGPHLIDQALYLFGMPEAVFADIRQVRPSTQVDDYFELILYYDKLHVRLKSSFLVREPGPSFILHGTKGSFLKSRADKQEENLRAGIKPNTTDWYTEPESEYGLLHTERDGVVTREKVKSQQGNYLCYYDAIYQSIVNHQALPVTAEDGINIMRIIEAAIESHDRQKLVSLR